MPPNRLSAWQSFPSVQLLAAFIGVAPMYLLAILGGMTGEETSPITQMPSAGVAVLETLAELLVFGGLMLLALHLLCGESLRQLNLKPGSLANDVLLSLGLFGRLLLGLFIFSQFAGALGLDRVPDSNLEMGRILASNPLLAAAFLGPVIWLKAAVLEELSRVFLLSRMWKVYPVGIDRWAVLVFSSLLFGLGHIWQGAMGILATAVIGFIFGWHYLRHGRVLPLILVHGVYDTLVLLLLIWASSSGMEQYL